MRSDWGAALRDPLWWALVLATLTAGYHGMTGGFWGGTENQCIGAAGVGSFFSFFVLPYVVYPEVRDRDGR